MTLSATHALLPATNTRMHLATSRNLSGVRANLGRLNSLIEVQNKALEALKQDYEAFSSSARLDLQKVSDVQSEIKLIISYLAAMEGEMTGIATSLQQQLDELKAKFTSLEDKETVRSYHDKVRYYQQNIELCAYLASSFIAAIPAIKSFLTATTHASFSRTLFLGQFTSFMVNKIDIRVLILRAAEKIINENESVTIVENWLVDSLPSSWCLLGREKVAKALVNILVALKNSNYSSALGTYMQCVPLTNLAGVDQNITDKIVPALSSSINVTTKPQESGLQVTCAFSGMALWAIAKTFSHYLIPEPNEKEKAALNRLKTHQDLLNP